MSALFFRYSLPLYLWVVLQLILTSLPGSAMPEINVFNWDKMAHAAFFAVLATLLSRHLLFAVKKSLADTRFSAIVLLVTYAAIDELHQILIPGRSCDIYDFCIDSLGIILGVLGALYYYQIMKKVS